MTLDAALLTLLHVLVFVYWLGGDLGAFYASQYLTKPGVDAKTRLFAAKIVGDVDMAPRFALIAALPTGLALAERNEWADIGWPTVIAVIVAAGLWALLAWTLHVRHGQPKALAALDRAIRLILLVVLAGLGLMILLADVGIAGFLGVKLILLAAAIALGLAIRGVLKPLGPALVALSDPQTEADGAASLRNVMARARPLVLLIWGCLLAASLAGLWKPPI